MYEIQLRKGGEWTSWTSTANKGRLPILLALARTVHPTKKVRWVQR